MGESMNKDKSFCVSGSCPFFGKCIRRAVPDNAHYNDGEEDSVKSFMPFYQLGECKAPGQIILVDG